MQILLANAKLMRDATSSYQLSQPLFQAQANGIATEMATKSTEGDCQDARVQHRHSKGELATVPELFLCFTHARHNGL